MARHIRTVIKLRGECERDVVLGRCGWEGFLGIEYSLDREKLALSLAPAEGLRGAYIIVIIVV